MTGGPGLSARGGEVAGDARAFGLAGGWARGAPLRSESGEAGRWVGRGASLGRASAVSGETLGLAGMAARERTGVWAERCTGWAGESRLGRARKGKERVGRGFGWASGLGWIF